MNGDFQLDEWVVSPRLNSLRRNGTIVRLEPKVMQVLVCLAESEGVVSKEKLMSTVWTDTFVTDDVLTRSISELRKAFEDDRKNPRYIQTIPKGGYRLLAPVEEMKPAVAPLVAAGEQLAPLPGQARARLVPLGIGATLALLIIFFAYAIGRRTTNLPIESPRPILAVLPFHNLSNDEQQDYFADGLTAEMISQFGRLPSERLGVIAWNTMARYKAASQNEDQIGKDLGANYLLEGTVRRSGNEVRVTAELVQAGKRDHLWSNSYTGSLEDVLAIQGKIAHEIASEILVQLSPQEDARFRVSATVNGAGYDAYLKGKFKSETLSSVKTSQKEENLRQAIRLIPGYAPPYVEMAAHYRSQASRGLANPKSSYEAGLSLIEKALKVDPNSAGAHRELAWIEWRYNWDFAAADKEFRRALEIDPNDAGAHVTYGLFLKSMGRFEEAWIHASLGTQLSPMEPYCLANAGSLLAMMKRYGEAEAEFAKAIQLSPQEPYVYERLGPVYLMEGKNSAAVDALERARDYSAGQQDKLAWLGYAYAKSGRKADALNILGQLKTLASQGQYVSPLHVALVYSGMGDKDLAIAWLEKARVARDEYLVYLGIYPEFQNLHSEPRFQELLRKLGFKV